MKKGAHKSPVTNEDLARLIENLAISTARGFSDMDKRFEGNDNLTKTIIDRLDGLGSSVADIKRTLGPIVQMIAISEREINSIKLRLNRVERKVGIN